MIEGYVADASTGFAFSAPFAASTTQSFTTQATRLYAGATSPVNPVALAVDDITIDTAALAPPSQLMAARGASAGTGNTSPAITPTTVGLSIPHSVEIPPASDAATDGPGRRPAFRQLPLSFIPNAGQAAEATTRFQVRGLGGVLAFAPGELMLALRTPTRKRNSGTGARDPRRPPHDRVPPITVRKRWIGASPTAELTGTLNLPGRANFLIGNDPAKWHTNLPTYAGIVTQHLYPGIDLYEQGTDGTLKGTYVVAPGADPGQIRWRYLGADSIGIDAAGNLVVSLPAPTSTLTDTEVLSSTLTELAPVAWQTIGERDVAVPVRYLIGPDGSVSFALGAYDPTVPLTIDPTLTYSTYLSGSGNDYGYGIAVDSAGNSYVTGRTASATFPADGPIQGTNAGGYDVFVSKLNASGSALIYSTLLGGTGNDEGYDIAVDSAGNAAVTGSTNWSGFPTVNPLSGQGSYHSGVDAFVAKLNPAGSGLIYSTYLGDTADEYGNGIAIDSSGNAYVAGKTASANFPTTVGARQTVKDVGYDAFVTKLVWNGTTLSYGYSTFLGGNNQDDGQAIAVDGLGNAYVAGNTTSTVFPTVNPRQSACGDTAPACWDAFVTKVNPSGSAFIYSTYLGGASYDNAWSIAVDGSGSAYVTGETDSSNFPTTVGAFQTANPTGTDAFVSKLAWNGTTLSYGYSTYLGGSGTDDGDGITVDSVGNAYVTGATTSTDFPTRGPLQSANAGGTDAFVTGLNASGSALVYGTYLGGSSFERGFDIVGDGVGNIYLTGTTQSSNFPTANPAQGTARGGYDAFVSQLNLAQRVTHYTYDGLQRLIGANALPGSVSTYTYDLAGNRTTVQLNGGTPTMTTYNNANQITNAGFTYDAAGNLTNDGTAAYTYDALSRTTARGSTIYASNGDGTLVSQTASSITTRSTQDLAAPLSQVLQTQIGAATRTDYLYGLNRLASLNGSTKTWYAADALGSVRRTVTDAGVPLGVITYDPWGTPEAGTVPTFGFTGEVQDVGTGLVNLRARWYSTGRGQFTSVDPYAGVAKTPYSLHQYAYGLSNPVLMTDPSGKRPPNEPDTVEGIFIHRMIQADFENNIVPKWPGYNPSLVSYEYPVEGASKQGLLFQLIDCDQLLIKGKPTGNVGYVDIIDFKARQVYEIKGIRSEARGRLELLWYQSFLPGYGPGTYMYDTKQRTIGDWPGSYGKDWLVRAENRAGVIVYWGVQKPKERSSEEREPATEPRPHPALWGTCKTYLEGECTEYYDWAGDTIPAIPGVVEPGIPPIPAPKIPSLAPA